jgi:hypothetical protein
LGLLQGGWFRTGAGPRCDRLTLSDAYGRDLLRCQAAARPDEAHERPVFETAFGEYGLPRAIRSDNGPPFAAPAAGGLSRRTGGPCWASAPSAARPASRSRMGGTMDCTARSKRRPRHRRRRASADSKRGLMPSGRSTISSARTKPCDDAYEFHQHAVAGGLGLRVKPGCGRDAWQFSDQEVRGAAP